MNPLHRSIKLYYRHILVLPVCLPTFLSFEVQVAIDGGIIGEFDVYAGSTFNALGIEQAGVHTLTFTSVGLAENDWIGFVEVSDAH